MSSKAVLITGCSTGIGRATAEHLAASGHTVYATARRVESIADLEAAGCRTLALDVTDEASMRAAVDTVVAAEGAVGVLVNNAGYSQSGALETLDMEDVRRQFETNVFGLLRMCQLVLPGMREQRWGRIVNLSSMGANFTFPGGGVYHATKYAVDALSDALRFEVAGFGVGVTIVQPGLIRTEFGETAAAAVGDGEGDGPYASFNASVAESTKQVYERGALARLGAGPEAVAKAIGKAINAGKAPIRVRVTPSAHLLVTQRRLMTAGMWDAMLRSQFPQPGKP
jgi:NAD(P)-dependent dehydrogenase (short-subunit alcohol dehydrogenase family)